MGDPGTFGGGSAESGPGEGRGTHLVERLEREIADAGAEAAEAALRALLEGPALIDFLAEVTAYRRRAFPATVTRVVFVKTRDDLLKGRIGHLPIAILEDGASATPEPLPNRRPGPSRVVRLSAETAVKQVVNHPELTTEDHRRVPEVVRRGRMLREIGGRHLAFFLESDSRHSCKAVGKRTSNDEVFLTTFQKIRNSDVRRAERRSLNKDRRRGPDTRGASASASARPGGARWGLPSGRTRQPHIALSSSAGRVTAGGFSPCHARHPAA